MSSSANINSSYREKISSYYNELGKIIEISSPNNILLDSLKLTDIKLSILF